MCFDIADGLRRQRLSFVSDLRTHLLEKQGKHCRRSSVLLNASLVSSWLQLHLNGDKITCHDCIPDLPWCMISTVAAHTTKQKEELKRRSKRERERERETGSIKERSGAALPGYS